jgi:protein-S-isoprenylcysteine O-methyltransferase Ste14
VLLRHLLALALLPGVMAVVMPIWIAQGYGETLALSASVTGLLAQALGLLVLSFGLVLFVASLRNFSREGEGTLAPWDPPRKLVVRGPYRYVRNPMISGVVFVLFGEALILLSRPHFWWALIFVAINLVYIPLFEEQQLRDRFGGAYAIYCRHVPRLVPRFSPWEQA